MKIKTKISKEIIRNLSDEQIEQLVYNKASDKYFETFGETFDDTYKDKILEQIFACSVLNNEVCNGGFDQFLTNNESLTELALIGLLKIDAIEHYNLLKIAKKFHHEQKADYCDMRNPNLDELDEKYYELNGIEINRQKFIIKNIEMFYD